MSRRMKIMKHNDTPINLNYVQDQDYEVEDILNHDEAVTGNRMYFIKWKGYDESWNSWEPESMLDNCEEKLKEYKIKSGLPLGPQPATIKLTPEKSQPGSGVKGNGKSSAKRSARKSGVKRKILNDLPAKPKRTHISVSPRHRYSNPASAPSATVTSSNEVTSTTSCTKSQILEVLDDGNGKRIVSIQTPDRVTPGLMWYVDARERHPELLIDFYEKHLVFRKSGGQYFTLVPPE